MAERNWGGRRTPQNPAPVSGPGQLSQRTDGGPQQVLSEVSGMAYGENQAMESLQSAAPLSASGQATARASRRAPSRRGAASGMGATPLMAPTQRPDEPVTAGAPFGPGAGPSPMRPIVPQRARPTLTDTLRKLADATYDPQIIGLLNVAERKQW